MRVLIVRHAPAEDPDGFKATGAPDEERPLTDAGRKSARKAARALKQLVPRIDTLATSPLVRARDTARALSREYQKLHVLELPELRPGFSEKNLLAWLINDHGSEATVALVGHEPDLSRFAGWLLTGRAHPVFALKKGGACLLDLAHELEAGRGELLWLLTPAHLRELGQ